jgi:signal peptidase II
LSHKTIAAVVIFSILVFDQVLKFWIKLNMQIGDEFSLVGSWARIHFIENEGMAYGISFGQGAGKLALTFFRLIAVFGLSIFLYFQIKNKAHKGFIVCLSMILAGALGNIVDSVFYAVIFSDSHGQLAQLFPPEGGYGSWFRGKVVDMFYFPIIQSYWPTWVPVVGGRYLEFFRPVFNVADSAITLGVFTFLIFQGRFLPEEKKAKKADSAKL